jgi:hypothetical protein
VRCYVFSKGSAKAEVGEVSRSALGPRRGLSGFQSATNGGTWPYSPIRKTRNANAKYLIKTMFSNAVRFKKRLEVGIDYLKWIPLYQVIGASPCRRMQPSPLISLRNPIMSPYKRSTRCIGMLGATGPKSYHGGSHRGMG